VEKSTEYKGVYRWGDDGTWGFRARDIDGTQTSRSGYSSELEAHLAHLEFKENIRNRQRGDYTRYTVKQFFEMYIGERTKAGKLKEVSALNYRVTLRRHLRPIHDTRIGELKRETVKDLLYELAEQSPVVANKARLHLRVLIRYAIDLGAIPREKDPMVRIDPFKQDAPKKGVLEVEDIPRLLGACNPDEKIVVVLGLFAGLREKEIFELTWERVDLKGRWIAITDAKTRAGNRRVPIIGPLEELLREYRRGSTELQGPVVRNLKYHLWPSNTFPAIRERAGLKGVKTHGLRHTFGTLIADSGTPPQVLCQLMGHTRYQFTFDRYYHARTETLEEGMRGLEAVCKKVCKIS